MFNPPRRRRRHHVRAARRRHYRRNPPRLLSGLGGLIPPVRQILEGAAGAAATRLLPGLAAQYVSPAIPTDGMGGYAVKAGAAILAGMGASAVLGRECGRNVAAGGFIVIADQILRENVYPSVPMPLGAYLANDSGGSLMGAYLSPGAVVPRGELESYLGDPDDLAGMDMPSRLDANERL